MKPAIIATNLTKKYGDKTAVEDLNLAVNQGELYSLLGVNGAGKTTTIKMLSCLIKPTSGDASLCGYSVQKEALKVKEKINVSPQETAIAMQLSVRENLEFISGIYGHEKTTAKDKATEVIESLGLTAIEHSKARILSGGWQRRLSIAMALISDPEILFLDEPTLGLDVIARRELWQTIESLKGRKTVILTTHYLEEAESLSDQIGIMTCGRLNASGTPAELKEQAEEENFEDAFVKLCSGGTVQ